MKPLIFIATLFISYACFAQKEKTWIDAHGAVTNNRDSAVLIKTISGTSSSLAGHSFTENYITGEPFRIVKLSDSTPMGNGECTMFYPSGQKLSYTVYVHNNPEKVTLYYPNGVTYLVISYQYIGNNEHNITIKQQIISSNDSTGKSLIVEGTGHFIRYKPEIVNRFSKDDPFLYNLYYEFFDTPYYDGYVRNRMKEGIWKAINPKNLSEYAEEYKDDKLARGWLTDSAGKKYTYTVSAGLYNVIEYYKSGKPESISKSTRIDQLQREGEYISFWPNGNKKRIANYENGRLTGKDSSFFYNGQLHAVLEYNQLAATPEDSLSRAFTTAFKTCNDSTGKVLLINGNGYFTGDDEESGVIAEEGMVKNEKKEGLWKATDAENLSEYTEEYKNGELIQGQSVAKDGKRYTYNVEDAPASFPGGMHTLYAFLGKKLRYPGTDMERGIQGVVFVTFVVEKDGRLTNIWVTRTMSENMSREVVRVLKLSPPWDPKRRRGLPLKQQFTIPVHFTLAKK